jgi:hypothetical protein
MTRTQLRPDIAPNKENPDQGYPSQTYYGDSGSEHCPWLYIRVEKSSLQFSALREFLPSSQKHLSFPCDKFRNEWSVSLAGNFREVMVQGSDF